RLWARVASGMGVNSISEEREAEYARHDATGGGRLDFSANFSDHSNAQKCQASQDENVRQRCVHQMRKQVAHPCGDLGRVTVYSYLEPGNSLHQFFNERAGHVRRHARVELQQRLFLYDRLGGMQAWQVCSLEKLSNRDFVSPKQ